MGEYATYAGESIKIGTCENMYYLRADDRHKVSNYRFDRATLAAVRFRFPWPDEDGLRLGSRTHSFMGLADFDRAMEVPGFQEVTAGEQCEHRTTYARGDCGVQSLVQEKVLADGRIVPVLQCACGGRYRIEDNETIELLVVAIRNEADRHLDADLQKWTDLHEIATRVLEHAQMNPTLPDAEKASEKADGDILEQVISLALAGTREARIEIIKALVASL